MVLKVFSAPAEQASQGCREAVVGECAEICTSNDILYFSFVIFTSERGEHQARPRPLGPAARPKQTTTNIFDPLRCRLSTPRGHEHVLSCSGRREARRYVPS